MSANETTREAAVGDGSAGTIERVPVGYRSSILALGLRMFVGLVVGHHGSVAEAWWRAAGNPHLAAFAYNLTAITVGMDLLLLAAGATWSMWSRRTQARWLARQQHRPAREVFTELLQRIGAWSFAPASRLLLAAARRADHWCGVTIVGGARERPGPIAPFRTSFEPVRLNERDEAFEALRLQHEGDGAACNTSTHDLETRRRRHAYVLAFVAAMGVVAAILLLRAPSAGLVTTAVAVALVVREDLWLDLICRLQRLGCVRGTWYMVPGGLLVLEPRGTRHRPNLFDRRTSVLIAHPVARNPRHWLVIVGDGRAVAWRAVSVLELCMLLAAWLSPLSPPAGPLLDRLTRT